MAYSLLLLHTKKKWKDRIAELDSHVEYTSKLRKSSVELNRQAFRAVFMILFLISTGLALPKLVNIVMGMGNSAESLYISLMIQAITLGVAAGLSFESYRAYSDIVNYKKALTRIDHKREKLAKKINDIF